MKILFVASEATPLAKTGGLADVVGSLPKELARQGHDVRIVIPRYRQTATAALSVNFTGISGMIACGPDMEEARLFESAIDDVPFTIGTKSASGRPSACEDGRPNRCSSPPTPGTVPHSSATLLPRVGAR